METQEHPGAAALREILADRNSTHKGYLAIQYLAARLEVAERLLSERSKPFVPPTSEEVEEYCRTINFPEMDGEAFVAHYESNGWCIGKAKMRNWRSACVTWKKRRIEDKQVRGKSESDSIPLMN